MQISLHRPNGKLHMINIPEASPDGLLEAVKWPKEVAAAIKTYDAKWVELNLAVEEQRDARDAANGSAPQADKQALIAALRSGQADPGLVATNAAMRAEEVAFVRLTQVVAPDCERDMRAALTTVRDWFKANPEIIAKHEIEMLNFAEQARIDATKAVQLADIARQSVGSLWRGLKGWEQTVYAPDIDEPNSLLSAGTGHGDRQNNADVRAYFERMAGIEPAPLDPNVVRPAGPLVKF
ncbi:hypothetical protein ACWPKO_19630 (plasmid) [Coraliomargarita sp. W4R53]